MPLVSGAADEGQIESLMEHLRDSGEFGGALGLPSTAFSEPAFDPRCYWRGPAWINVHWLLIRGLKRCGRLGEARRWARAARRLVARGGFREYYHPFSGEGLGARGFAWSSLAALL